MMSVAAARQGSRSGASIARLVRPAPPCASTPSPSVSRAMACAVRRRASSILTLTTCTPVLPAAARTPCGSGASFGISAFPAPRSRLGAGSANGARARRKPRSDDGRHRPMEPGPRHHRSPRCPRRSSCRGISCASLTTSTPRPPRRLRASCGTARRPRSSISAGGSAGSSKAAAVRRAQAARQSRPSMRGWVRHAPAVCASSRASPPVSPRMELPFVPPFASPGAAVRPRGRSTASSC